MQHFAPKIEKRLCWQWRRPRSRSWRVDETYIKVHGKWAYLYRAVDKFANTTDFYLSSTRNTKAAKRFLGNALKGFEDWEQPNVLNTNKAPTYAAAITELKAAGAGDLHGASEWIPLLGRGAAIGRQIHAATRTSLNESAFGLITDTERKVFVRREILNILLIINSLRGFQSRNRYVCTENR